MKHLMTVVLGISLLLTGCAPFTPLPKLTSSYGNDWAMTLNRLDVINAQEDSFLSGGDEPYFVMVGFRSSFNDSNSTRVSFNKFKNDDWASGIEKGEGKPIPKSMGEMKFDNVKPFEVLGVIMIAMESDNSSFGQVQRIMNSHIKTPLTKSLNKHVSSVPMPPKILKSVGETNKLFNKILNDAFSEESFFDTVENFLEAFGDTDQFVGINIAIFQHRAPLANNFPAYNPPNGYIKNYLQPLEYSARATGIRPLVFKNPNLNGTVIYNTNFSVTEK